MKTRVLIADDDPIIRMDIRMILENDGYEVVGEAADGIEAVAVCEIEKPDIVIMDIQMPLFNGLKAAELINEKQLCDCIIILTAYAMDHYVKDAIKMNIMGYIVKPVSAQRLLPEIKVAYSMSREMSRLKKEISSSKKAMEDRKKMERAKGILMKQYNLTEEEAYLKLRKLAMDKRCSMSTISNFLIMNEK